MLFGVNALLLDNAGDLKLLSSSSCYRLGVVMMQTQIMESLRVLTRAISRLYACNIARSAVPRFPAHLSHGVRIMYYSLRLMHIAL